MANESVCALGEIERRIGKSQQNFRKKRTLKKGDEEDGSVRARICFCRACQTPLTNCQGGVPFLFYAGKSLALKKKSAVNSRY